jgi:hypothetical protein
MIWIHHVLKSFSLTTNFAAGKVLSCTSSGYQLLKPPISADIN